jgi:hypothetical protein
MVEIHDNFIVLNTILPAGDLKRSPDPSPTLAPLTTNPGSAPDTIVQSGHHLIEMCTLNPLKTDIYLNDNFEPTTPFLSDQKNLILSINFVG